MEKDFKYADVKYSISRKAVIRNALCLNELPCLSLVEEKKNADYFFFSPKTNVFLIHYDFFQIWGGKKILKYQFQKENEYVE